MNNIMVSINCLTYNQEDYISDAINSFLMQKTNFTFEILIHDDASTDKTTNIIKEYEKKFPGVIKPLYQINNQYSKGVKVSSFNFMRTKGKYIAMCEGDDYWTDPLKLQKQVDYMETHPDCSLCVHASYRVKTDKSKLKPHLRPNDGNKLYTVEEIILGGGGLFATNSMLYPSKLLKNRPDFYNNAPVGDYPLTLYLALMGNVFYIDRFMSAYRAGVPGSWTNNMKLSGIKKHIEHVNRTAEMLREFNRFTEFKYDSTVRRKILNDSFNLLLKQGMVSEVKKGEYKDLYTSLHLKTKFMLFMKQHYPELSNALIKFINLMRNAQ